MKTKTIKAIYESEDGYFSFQGDGQFGSIFRTGWKPTKLGCQKKIIIGCHLNSPYVSDVFRRGKKIFVMWLNGREDRIA